MFCCNWSAASTVGEALGKTVASTRLREIPRRGGLLQLRPPRHSGLSPLARRSPANAAPSEKGGSGISAAATGKPPSCVLSSRIPFFHDHVPHTGSSVSSRPLFYENDFLLVFIYFISAFHSTDEWGNQSFQPSCLSLPIIAHRLQLLKPSLPAANSCHTLQ